MTKGCFITFEGGEGAGKTTQILLLAEYLRSCGKDVVVTKEPGGTEVGRELRKVLCTGDPDKLDPLAETLLYYADRRMHLQQKVLPALAAGKWVISDRFADSTTAYQCYGYGGRIKKEVMDALYRIAVGDFYPDLTIVLDIDPQKGLARSLQRNETAAEKEIRFEQKELAFHNNLRRGFLEIARTAPRYVVLDADKSVEELYLDIVKTTEERLLDR